MGIRRPIKGRSLPVWEPDPTIETEPTLEEMQFLEDRIYEYNVERTGIKDGVYLAIFDRDASGQIVAGLFGWTWGGCCEIRDLWVRQDLRRLDYGTRLVSAAEKEARARGCHLMMLDTHSFQAPNFYRRFGFEIVNSIAEYPRGHQKHRMVKRLA